MAKKTVITISRQSGSRGSEIGSKLASALGWEFYDKNILKKAAQESGFCEEILESMDERPKSLLFSLVMDPYNIRSFGTTPYDSLEQNANDAIYQSIEKVAEEGPCVIVGRCADYVLREREDVLNIFITSPLENRVKHVADKLDFPEKKAADCVRKTDKRRASYYNYISNHKWGDVNRYDLCIDSSILGVEGTVSLVLEMLKKCNE